jgi:hypothetical protein
LFNTLAFAAYTGSKVSSLKTAAGASCSDSTSGARFPSFSSPSSFCASAIDKSCSCFVLPTRIRRTIHTRAINPSVRSSQSKSASQTKSSKSVLTRTRKSSRAADPRGRKRDSNPRHIHTHGTKRAKSPRCWNCQYQSSAQSQRKITQSGFGLAPCVFGLRPFNGRLHRTTCGIWCRSAKLPGCGIHGVGSFVFCIEDLASVGSSLDREHVQASQACSNVIVNLNVMKCGAPTVSEIVSTKHQSDSAMSREVVPSVGCT